jgi:hypothetical protein
METLLINTLHKYSSIVASRNRVAVAGDQSKIRSSSSHGRIGIGIGIPFPRLPATAWRCSGKLSSWTSVVPRPTDRPPPRMPDEQLEQAQSQNVIDSAIDHDQQHISPQSADKPPRKRQPVLLPISPHPTHLFSSERTQGLYRLPHWQDQMLRVSPVSGNPHFPPRSSPSLSHIIPELY